jgi:2-polyprenyl-3-methyl-5-hydroxy-6-metoxy-1,4-benzoquinol methylase
MLSSMTPYGRRLDVDRRQVRLELCRHCTAIVNVSDLCEAERPEGNRALQSDSSKEFYAVTQDVVDSFAQRLVGARLSLDFLLSNVAQGFEPRVFADVGAGYGFTAAAATERFDRVYAIDYNTVALEALRSHFPKPERLHIRATLEETEEPFDAVMLWHVLEHCEDAVGFLRDIGSKLRPGGTVFVQCPMYRDPYVVFTHFTFHNETSLRTMCLTAGLRCDHVWFDVDNQFITCLATRPLHGNDLPDVPKGERYLGTDDYRNRLATLEAERVGLEERCISLESATSEILASTSWRLTSPLRRLVSALRVGRT